MKKKTIALPHCEVMLVEVPEDTLSCEEIGDYLYFTEKWVTESSATTLKKRGDLNGFTFLSLIDKDTPLSEENAERVMEWKFIEQYSDMFMEPHEKCSASEAFSTLLQMEQVYFTNPVPMIYVPLRSEMSQAQFNKETKIYLKNAEKRKKAQELVWGKTAVLIKPINNK